jgi:hypothetical protein
MTQKLSGNGFDGTGRCLSEVLSKNLPGGNEKNHDSSQSVSTVCQSRFEPENFSNTSVQRNSHTNLCSVSTVTSAVTSDVLITVTINVIVVYDV